MRLWRSVRAALLGLGVLGSLLALPAPGLRAQGALSALESDVDIIARNARPSVVTIVARSTSDRPRASAGSGTRIGSGVAIAEDEVLTTASVVQGARRIWVRTVNSLQLEATVVGVDPIANVALLKVPGVRLPPMRFGVTRPPRVGDWVITVGTSRDNAERITHTLGSIAYRHRDPRLALWQLTNSVFPGFSGAAVVNSWGELVGLLEGQLDPESQAGVSASERIPQGMSFMLPVESLRPVFLALKGEGRVHYGYLGVSTRAVSVESETARGTRVPLGAEILDVVPGGPAALAGLKRGDLVVAFEGVPVEYPAQLARWVAASTPASTVNLVWVRNEYQQQGRVTLGESPAAQPDWAGVGPFAGGTSPRGASPARIADLERQIQVMNRELSRLKSSSADSR